MDRASSLPASALGQARLLFDQGLADFRAGKFFEAHDIWEELWQELRGPDRLFLQGLIHLAVGAYHRDNGNHRGATSQWRKAVLKLERYPEGHWGVDTSRWRAWTRLYQDDQSRHDHPDGLPFDPAGFPTVLPLAPGS
jgi:predicted metal-dependent hydrolase